MQYDDEKQKAIQTTIAELMKEIQRIPSDEQRIISLLDELTVLRFGTLIPEEPDLTEEEIEEIIKKSRKVEKQKAFRKFLLKIGSKLWNCFHC